jgi:hypothetical protein
MSAWAMRVHNRTCMAFEWCVGSWLYLDLKLAIGSSHQFRAARGEQLWRLV